MKHKNIFFLTLKVFSATGGIEKVCRVAGKIIYEYSIQENLAVQIFSMHGPKKAGDGNQYFPSEIFTGFSGKKIKCILASIRQGRKSKVVLMSHINLMLIGWIIKKISPSTKIILFAHGIEVWKPLSYFKKKMVHCCDEIICVSQFTADKVEKLQGVSPAKIKVLNNCLDPFLPLPSAKKASLDLRKRYDFTEENQVLFTLTRLAAKERYKGYDNVMRAMVNLKNKYRNIRYLLAGSYDKEEKAYVDNLIKDLGLEAYVVMTGFIAENELANHFSMADVYVMPSMKEGFGIVFIEAMYYGVPVIAGNADGSTDALCNGLLGILVDPLNIDEIEHAIEKILVDPGKYAPDHDLLLRNFSYNTYKRNLEKILA